LKLDTLHNSVHRVYCVVLPAFAGTRFIAFIEFIELIEFIAFIYLLQLVPCALCLVTFDYPTSNHIYFFMRFIHFLLTLHSSLFLLPTFRLTTCVPGFLRSCVPVLLCSCALSASGGDISDELTRTSLKFN